MKTEFEINNRKIEYDACSSNCDINYAKIFYDAFDYIASSNIYYINDKKFIAEKIHHFFRYKSENNIKLIRLLKLKNIKNI